MAPARRSWVRDNGLTLVLAALFLCSFAGQVFAGHASENDERLREGAGLLSLSGYIVSGSFLSSVFENWESEFLQMWAYVMLTAYLFQRGSPESRDPDGEEERPGEGPGALKSLGDKLYAHSLGLALLFLFAFSFFLHWANSARHAAEKARNGPCSRRMSIDSPGRFSLRVVNDWRTPCNPALSVARVCEGPRSCTLASAHQGRKLG